MEMSPTKSCLRPRTGNHSKRGGANYMVMLQRRAETDPSLEYMNTIDLWLYLPTYLSGCLLNGGLVIVFVHARQTLTAKRLERVVLALLCVCLVWSLSSIVRLALGARLSPAGPFGYNQYAGAQKAVMLTLILATNMRLALERHFIFRPQYEGTHVFDTLCVGLMFVLSVFYCILFMSSPSSDGIMPDHPIQKSLWFFSSLVFGGGVLIATAVLYAWTYVHVVQMLRSGMRNGREEIMLEKLVLRSCIIMSGSLYLCYFPQFIVSAVGLSAYSPAGVFAAECVALDVIVTPVLSFMLLRQVQEETLEFLASVRMRWRSK